MNTNPFEYWVDFPNSSFSNLMTAVQNFVDNPNSDVEIREIFTEQMFSDLCNEMSRCEIKEIGLIQKLWTDEYRGLRAIRGFLLDTKIGAKRLASMPDRITNTICLADGNILRRPSAISAYNEASLSNVEVWWEEWKKFMFHTNIEILTMQQRAPAQPVCSLIEPLLGTKYPAISPEELAASIPLQILCLAVIDAIFIFILNNVQPGVWEPLKKDLSSIFITGKTSRICSVLAHSYLDRNVILLQEASAALFDELLRCPEIHNRFELFRPEVIDYRRNQNSLILLGRAYFRTESALDVTQQVISDVMHSTCQATRKSLACVREYRCPAATCRRRRSFSPPCTANHGRPPTGRRSASWTAAAAWRRGTCLRYPAPTPPAGAGSSRPSTATAAGAPRGRPSRPWASSSPDPCAATLWSWGWTPTPAPGAVAGSAAAGPRLAARPAPPAWTLPGGARPGFPGTGTAHWRARARIQCLPALSAGSFSRWGLFPYGNTRTTPPPARLPAPSGRSCRRNRTRRCGGRRWAATGRSRCRTATQRPFLGTPRTGCCSARRTRRRRRKMSGETTRANGGSIRQSPRGRPPNFLRIMPWCSPA